MKNIPILVHECNDLEIEYHGGSYNPHEGENVWFIPYLSTPDMLALIELSNAENEDTLSVLVDDVCPVLVKVIDSWNWTHPLTGETMGMAIGNGERCKPGADDISPLHPREIVYLVNAFFEETQPEEENPQPAS